MKTCKKGLHQYEGRRCMECRRTYGKSRRQADPRGEAARKKAWTTANRERAVANIKTWRKANPDKVAAHKKTWCVANTEKVAADSKLWRAANPMPDSLIRSRLGLRSGEAATPELIEAKRAQLKLARLLKEIQK